MRILKRDSRGWTEAVIEGRWCLAKVYNNPSRFGINGGRTSKLSISKTDTRDENQHFFEQMDYNYSRGLDFDTLPNLLLDKIIAQLQVLPVI